MNFKPLSNHVFLETAEEEKVTKSGIVLPEGAEKEKPIKGKVLAVGPGKMKDNGTIQPMAVKVGDMVLFKKYGPDEIEMDGKKYLVGDEDDILAIIE
jgi:chaperonin GroES